MRLAVFQVWPHVSRTRALLYTAVTLCSCPVSLISYCFGNLVLRAFVTLVQRNRHLTLWKKWCAHLKAFVNWKVVTFSISCKYEISTKVTLGWLTELGEKNFYEQNAICSVLSWPRQAVILDWRCGDETNWCLRLRPNVKLLTRRTTL